MTEATSGIAGSKAASAVVLLVDDHPLIRTALATVLAAQPWVQQVYEAGRVDETIRVAKATPVTGAVVDLGLPDGSGVDLVGRLRRIRPGCAVLVLTMGGDDSQVRRCLTEGARGYLLKSSPPEVVVRAVQTVLEGGLVLGPEVATAALDAETGKAVPAPFDRLTPRDLQLALMIVSGLTASQAARKLNLSEKTVRNRMTAAMATLGVPDRMQLALLAQAKGVFRPRT
jgi:DNA-binding NarL/FixJ family response regulator